MLDVPPVFQSMLELKIFQPVQIFLKEPMVKCMIPTMLER